MENTQQWLDLGVPEEVIDVAGDYTSALEVADIIGVDWVELSLRIAKLYINEKEFFYKRISSTFVDKGTLQPDIILLWPEAYAFMRAFYPDRTDFLVWHCIGLSEGSAQESDAAKLWRDRREAGQKTGSDWVSALFFVQAWHEEKTQPCWLYVMRAENSDQWKVGVSANVEKRRCSIQTSNADKIKIVFQAKAENRRIALQAEQFIHSRLSHIRSNGEWFEDADGGIMNAVRAGAAQFGLSDVIEGRA